MANETQIVFRQRLEAAVGLELPYGERPPLAEGVAASVLILFGFADSDKLRGASIPSLLVTRRTEQVETHKGQMAFPGGMREKGESDHDAALRETQEEVGIERDRIEIVGELPKLWTVTGFWVTPAVGILSSTIPETPLELNPTEIAEALWVPLEVLQDAETYRREWIERGAIRFPIHAYYVGPGRSLRVWGATGAIIHNLLERLAHSG